MYCPMAVLNLILGELFLGMLAMIVSRMLYVKNLLVMPHGEKLGTRCHAHNAYSSIYVLLHLDMNR